MREALSLEVTTAQSGFRADRALAALAPDMSRRDAKTFFRDGMVRLNGKAVDGNARVAAGDRLTISHSDKAKDKLKQKSFSTAHGRQVLCVYEDDDILVISKPPGIPVHRNPDGVNKRETLEDVLERNFGLRNADCGLKNEEASESRTVQSAIRNPQSAFYFCHRLDMDTTGCLLIAKNPKSRDALIRDFEGRRIGKTYLAVVAGSPPWEQLVVKRSIMYVQGGERETKRLRAVKMGVALEEGDARGKSCETAFMVIRRYKSFTLLRCEPKTGRMHQIRVHLAAEGYPLAYDPLYGRRTPLRVREIVPRSDGTSQGEKILLNRLPLHAWKLRFTHPRSGEKTKAEAPIPRDLKTFLQVLNKFRAT